MSSARYINYYNSQSGGSLHGIGPLYFNSRNTLQRGRGIGDFFSTVFRNLRPLISSGLSALKDQAITSGANIISDLGRKPLKEILYDQSERAIQGLAEKGVNKMRRYRQRGSGGIKRRGVRRIGHLPVKRRRRQVGAGKRKRRRRKTKSRKRTLDIFN